MYYFGRDVDIVEILFSTELGMYLVWRNNDTSEESRGTSSLTDLLVFKFVLHCSTSACIHFIDACMHGCHTYTSKHACSTYVLNYLFRFGWLVRT
jgi:hypothetical protein